MNSLLGLLLLPLASRLQFRPAPARVCVRVCAGCLLNREIMEVMEMSRNFLEGLEIKEMSWNFFSCPGKTAFWSQISLSLPRS